MNKSTGSALVYLIFIGGFLFFYFIVNPLIKLVTYSKPAAVTVTTCKLNISVYIHQGTNSNYTTSGQILLGNNIDSWSTIKKNLVTESGESDPVSLSLEDEAIRFILNTPKGQIFGVGAMESNAAICSGGGGGTLSGPQIGDLGDWRGKWDRETQTIATPQEPSPLSTPIFWLCTILPLAIATAFVLMIALRFAKILTPFKTTHAAKNKSLNTTLRKTNQTTKSKSAEGEEPLTEYLTAYAAGDRLFDLSFEIEKNGNYFGDCGITVAKTLDADSKQATALEVWLFDQSTSQTISHMLMSDYCYSDDTLRSELEKKGSITPIHPGATIIKETQGLKAVIKIMALDYESTPVNPKSVFKRVVVKIGVWKNHNTQIQSQLK